MSNIINQIKALKPEAHRLGFDFSFSDADLDALSYEAQAVQEEFLEEIQTFIKENQ